MAGRKSGMAPGDLLKQSPIREAAMAKIVLALPRPTERQVRINVQADVRRHLAQIWDDFIGNRAGFKYSYQVRSEFIALGNAMLALAREGKLDFSPAQQLETEISLRASIAAVDSAFQRFKQAAGVAAR
jgi:hypothetical protein